VLHGLCVAPDDRRAAAIGDGLQSIGRLRPLVGRFDRVIAGLSGASDAIQNAGRGLPAGAAHAEAAALRLRRGDVELEWGAPRIVASLADLLEACRERGRSSIELMRADPTLVTELQVGSWFDGDWRLRLLRRVALALPWTVIRRATPRAELGIELAGDIAFWRGVHEAATDTEWRRLTASSYVALVYHRLAGEMKAGQENIDLAPATFDRQLGALRRLGFRHLEPRDALGFHEDPSFVLPHRSFIVTLDDGTADCVSPLLRRVGSGIQLFVPTRELGGHAHWLDNEPLMGWKDVRAISAAGIHVGSHAQHHRQLTDRNFVDLVAELTGSLADLRAELDAPLDIVAYPNGAHDLDVRRASQASGFRAAYTTAKGRNGAGTDMHCLRRVSVHAGDGVLAVLWKVITGEGVPETWLWLRSRRNSLFALARSGRQT
jgi:peptidoglycan/xylan/chitin deacetylase (PgdA/CDA1 family)